MSVTEAAYIAQAERVKQDISTSYRFNADYLASKALVDWRLLHQADFIGKRVLNVGASEPIDEEQYAKYAKEWIGLDINQLIRPTVCADAASMPFADSSFDVVCAFSSLEHIERSDKRVGAFLECYRILRPMGRFVVSVPSRWNLAWKMGSERLMREGTADFGFGYNYSPLELRKLLIDLGFRIVAFAGDLMPAYAILPKDYPLRWFLQLFSARMGFLAVKTN